MEAGEARAALFEPHRGHLFGLAYRMLGSVAEAEDMVQDAYLRWHGHAEGVDNPRAWLSRTVTRLCLDRLKSAQARRETYVGPWLPEPVVDADASVGALAEDLSFALLLTLERLSPLERAAFLLHDVFDMGFPEVAAVLERSEEACRQLASRARTRVRQAGTRFQPLPEEEERLAAAFVSAVQTGDTEALTQLLATDAVFLADGGGRVPAAQQPVQGADKIARLLTGLVKKSPLPPGTTIRAARINGLPGFVLHYADGSPLQTTALEIADGRIAALYVVRNPDKLQHLKE